VIPINYPVQHELTRGWIRADCRRYLHSAVDHGPSGYTHGSSRKGLRCYQQDYSGNCIAWYGYSKRLSQITGEYALNDDTIWKQRPRHLRESVSTTCLRSSLLSRRNWTQGCRVCFRFAGLHSAYPMKFATDGWSRLAWSECVSAYCQSALIKVRFNLSVWIEDRRISVASCTITCR
jgi:hypothetical protein